MLITLSVVLRIRLQQLPRLRVIPYKNIRLSCKAPFSLLSIMKKALDINIVICYIMFISKKHLVDGASLRSLTIGE